MTESECSGSTGESSSLPSGWWTTWWRTSWSTSYTRTTGTHLFTRVLAPGFWWRLGRAIPDYEARRTRLKKSEGGSSGKQHEDDSRSASTQPSDGKPFRDSRSASTQPSDGKPRLGRSSMSTETRTSRQRFLEPASSSLSRRLFSTGPTWSRSGKMWKASAGLSFRPAS